ncbi:vps51 vps67 protein [Rutstroemia sp. NJR-2017a BVV2]|nr:vps51 vps67 protein [Rutstroemia sp. NJR-2017a BVV2]
MTSIAQPRDSSVNGHRVPRLATPTTSARPSLDYPRSAEPSPNRGPSAAIPRRNRAALREYYNLKKSQEAPTDDGASEVSSIHYDTEVQESEMDKEGFDGEKYVKDVLEKQTLGELLRTYNSVLTDIRALDAEKKALVYDNYSKLIAATETIRKMRTNMDPLNPMTSTLDPAIAHIYETAERIKAELKESLPEGRRRIMEMGEEERAALQKRNNTKKVVLRVLETPEKLRKLVADGDEEKARMQWEETLKLLNRWKERGVGGDDVQACIEDGEAALRGEPPNEKSWVNKKSKLSS